MSNYDAEDEIFQALSNDDELSSLAKGGFHNRVARKDSAFPRVVFSEITNLPTGYADNKEYRATTNFQVSIFTDGSTVNKEIEMIKAVDRIMKSIEYGKYDSQNLYEVDTKIYHKALRYEKNFYKGE